MLARARRDVVGLGQARSSDLPYGRNKPLGQTGEACADIKFKANGWENVNLLKLLSLSLLGDLPVAIEDRDWRNDSSDITVR